MFHGTFDLDGAVPVAHTAIQDVLFERGLYWASGRSGVVNLIAAHKWFNLAALKGRLDAIALRREIAEQMSESEIAAALSEARAWMTARKAPPRAGRLSRLRPGATRYSGSACKDDGAMDGEMPMLPLTSGTCLRSGPAMPSHAINLDVRQLEMGQREEGEASLRAAVRSAPQAAGMVIMELASASHGRFS